MAKDTISSYSTTAASNTDVGGVDIQGTAAASNMDNAVREVMSHLAETNAGTAPWADTMTIGNAADLTKELRFDLSGFTTATTRVLTPPNYNGTIATLAGTETFTNKTLTSPTITGPTITGPTITGATITSPTIATPTITDTTTITATNDGTTGPTLSLTHISASPAVDDVIANIAAVGRDSAGNSQTYGLIQHFINNPFSGAEYGRWSFATIFNGSATTRMHIAGGMYMDGATGGDKGAGTINATDVYNDNVALTCMALADEFRTSKEVFVDKWDDMVPGAERKHPTAQVFKELIDTGFDPRDPDQYFQKMEADQALPGMPNQSDWQHNSLGIGEMFSRLWLSVEMQALVIKSLADKLAALESPKG